MRKHRNVISYSKAALTITSSLVLSFSLAHAQPSPGVKALRKNLDQVIAQQDAESLRRLESNLDQKDVKPGAVIASPSKSNPNYYFHWIRDAALTMETFVLLRGQNPSHADWRLDRWYQFERGLQSLNTQTGLGEPKYNVDGTAFTGPWGRPQNDGPALRARTMMLWIQASKGPLKVSGGDVTQSIRTDLEYTAHHWRETSYDLWEEIKGDHFFTRMAQMKSLQLGAQYFAQLGDKGAADFYNQTAGEIGQSLQEFWSQDQKLIWPTIRQNDGWGHKKSNIDVAVLLASLYFTQGTEPWSLMDERVQSTMKKLKDSFSFYEVNKGSPVVFIGRYPEDIYDGNGFSHGNPWFLANTAYAQAQCRIAHEWEKQGQINVTELNSAFLSDYLATPASVRIGESLTAKDSRYQAIVNGLKNSALNYLDQVLYHAGRDGRMDEQFSRFNGYMMGAHDLSWSHASFLRASNECRPVVLQRLK